MRNKKLDQWLDKRSHRVLWAKEIPNIGLLECHAIGKGIAIVLIVKDGFEIFTSCGDNDITATFEDAAKRLSLK